MYLLKTFLNFEIVFVTVHFGIGVFFFLFVSFCFVFAPEKNQKFT